MRFLENGPDLPNDLIRAQLSGEVLFIVGAGVSKRVGLPLFNGLTQSVYEAISQAPPNMPDTLADIAEKEAWGRYEWDRVLGLLEKRIVYPSPNLPEVTNPIRTAVGKILQPKSRNLNPHKDILALSSDSKGRSRVVTTNFDTLFERAWRRINTEKPRTFTGPGLPAVGSPEFHGIIHLHGRIHDRSLGLAPTELVLTSADFGEAYLRSGWASRFVYDLLRRYTLVFVGYAADDPPMRYMLEATEAGRLKFPDLRRAYAFADVNAADSDGNVRARWRAKGLEPITYQNEDGSYDPLYATLKEWATFAKDRTAWADRQIETITAAPYADTPDEARAKVRFLVDTVSDLETLSKHAKSPDWIESRIKKGSQAVLSDRDANIWLHKWASKIETAKWCMTATAKSVAATIVSAVTHFDEISKPEPSNLLSQFWKIYRVAYSDQIGWQGRANWLVLQKRLRSGEVNYFTISAVVGVVQPVLHVRDSWAHFLRGRLPK